MLTLRLKLDYDIGYVSLLTKCWNYVVCLVLREGQNLIYAREASTRQNLFAESSHSSYSHLHRNSNLVFGTPVGY